MTTTFPLSNRARRLLLALGLAPLLALALLAEGARAVTPSLVGDGMHIASGALVDPAGRTWVSDHNGGFCRMTEPTDDGPGQIEHPQVPSDVTATRTCVGGLLPLAAVGPDAAGAPTFHDPSPEFPNSGDELAYVPDGASPSAAIFRLHWDPDLEIFQFDPNEPRDTILMDADVVEPDRPRPTHTALGADGNLYVIFQRSATIQRVLAPASATPTVQVIGQTSDANGALSLAAGRDADGAFVLYVGETTGIRTLRPNALLPNQLTQPTPYDIDLAAGLFGREGVPALAFDYDDGLLYAGSASELAPPFVDVGVDDVHRFDVDLPNGGPGSGTPYATGLSMVGGLAMGLGNEVLALDDRALLDAAEPLGEGRMFRLGPPGSRIVFGPSRAGDDEEEGPDRAFTNDTRPTFRFVGGPTRQCSLQPVGQPKVWASCSTSTSHRPASALTNGQTYVFSVRSIDGAATGLPHNHRFTVDTTAPATPTILRPTGTGIEPRRPFVSLSSVEADMTYACTIDSSSFNNSDPCATGRPFTFTTVANRTLRVWAVDRAGNRSTGFATRAFQADGVLPNVSVTSSPSAAFTQQRTITFNYAETNETGAVQFGCRVNDATFAICPGSSSGSRTLGPNLPDGSYTFEVHAMDAAGNLGANFTRTVTVDTTPPVVDSTRLRAVTGPSGAFPIAANEQATFRCSIDSLTLTSCGTSRSFTNLSAGSHTLRVQATDQAGNVSTHAHPFTVTIPDTTPPDVTISAPGQGDETQPNVYAVFSASDVSVPVTITCRLDGVTIPNCASPQLLEGLADGQHAFAVTARDADNNQRTVTRTWTVKRRGQGGAGDTIPPPPTVNGTQANRGVAFNVLALNPLTGDPLALDTLAVTPTGGAQGASGAVTARNVSVTLVADPGTRIVRLRVFRILATVPARVAVSKSSAKRALVGREFRRVKAERRIRIKLSKGLAGKLRAGRRYQLEVTPGTSRDTLGVPKSRTFSIKR